MLNIFRYNTKGDFEDENFDAERQLIYEIKNKVTLLGNFNLTFTYRFNQQKKSDDQIRGNDGGGSEEFRS